MRETILRNCDYRKLKLLVWQLIWLTTPMVVEGHGMLRSPRSRNWVASRDGSYWQMTPGVAPIETCTQCLNRNTGVCGRSPSYDYDRWEDMLGSPMPWQSQATYSAGQTIELLIELTAHHMGHFEMKACPLGRASTQKCFDEHPLVFIRDVSYDMPADPRFPERAYLSDASRMLYRIEYRLPENMSSQNVLLQWRYITANSCLPPGYAEYYDGSNSQSRVLPNNLWGRNLSPCSFPYPQDGSVGTTSPEQFWNCAEVTVLPQSQGIPVVTPTNPPPVPVVPSTPAPEVIPQVPPPAAATPPSNAGCCSFDFKSCTNTCGTTEADCSSCSTEFVAWLADGPLMQDLCLARGEGNCMMSQPCCPGLECVSQTARCAVPGEDVAIAPPSLDSPADDPPAGPTPVSESSSGGCCSMDYKECIDWCGTTEKQCATCSGHDCLHWLPTGAVQGSCGSRWSSCNASNPCCPGLRCEFHSVWYSQCVPERCR